MGLAFSDENRLLERALPGTFMKWFGLSPDAPTATPTVPSRRPVGLTSSIAYASVSFGLVSVLAYSIWAYRLVEGTAALYSSIAIVYLGLAGLALSRLVLAPGAWWRFSLLFAAGFFVYAIGWCAFWFGLKGRNYADLWGAIAGLAGLTWLLQRAFGATGGFVRAFVVLVALHSAGYYLGGELYASVRGANGRLLWGAAHGVGFGAGLGYVIFVFQTVHRIRRGVNPESFRPDPTRR